MSTRSDSNKLSQLPIWARRVDPFAGETFVVYILLMLPATFALASPGSARWPRWRADARSQLSRKDAVNSRQIIGPCFARHARATERSFMDSPRPPFGRAFASSSSRKIDIYAKSCESCPNFQIIRHSSPRISKLVEKQRFKRGLLSTCFSKLKRAFLFFALALACAELYKT